MGTIWRVRLLGRLQVEPVPDGPAAGSPPIVRFRTQKTAALLAYLAHHLPRAQPREALLELFWPDDDERAARTKLNVAVSWLRQQLEPAGVPSEAVLCTNRQAVLLNPESVITDVAEFEAALARAAAAGAPEERAVWLEQAVALYEGEFVAGCYEEWCLLERGRLLENYLTALHRLSDAWARAGDVEKALDTGRRAVSADPLREESHLHLMRLLLDTGQPAAALRQYRELDRLLRDELEQEPSLAARQLAQEAERLAQEDPRPERTAFAWPHAEEALAALQVQRAGAASLPQPLTPLIGRAEEVAELRQWLLSVETRLVTLLGPGGSGKTRLAVEAARCLVEPLAGAVWFVPLAEVTDAQQIAPAILAVFGLPPAPSLQPLEQAAEALRRAGYGHPLVGYPIPALLVLDNFEHLVEGGRSVVQALLERVPLLTCIVTSRRRLELPGESLMEVRPLPRPPDIDQPEALAQCPSVQLFVNRVRAVRPEFQLTRQNAPLVRELCRHTEGLPLALELAAARARILTLSQMLVQLQQRLDLVGSPGAALPPRQRSLRATLDLSDQLLSPVLQRFFARLSVFRGGWTLAAAEQVSLSVPNGSGSTGEAASALDYLDQLSGCSLVVAEEGDSPPANPGDEAPELPAAEPSEMRFGMLETLREYAAERLAPEEWHSLERQHALYYLEMAEEADREICGRHQVEWLRRLEAEDDNLRAALDWFTQAGDVERGLRLAAALGQFWEISGRFREGRDRLQPLLTQTPVTNAGAPAPAGGEVEARRRKALLRARALRTTGILAQNQSEHETAQQFLQQSLAIARQLGDRAGIAACLDRLGMVARRRRDFARARALHEESRTIWDALGDADGAAACLNHLGQISREEDEYAAARRLHEQSLALLRREGNRWARANVLHDLAMVLYAEGSYDVARLRLQESLTVRQELRDMSGIAACLNGMGLVALEEGDPGAARAFYEQALAIWRMIGHRWGVAIVLNNLGELHQQAGQDDRARHLHQQSLAIKRELEGRAGVAVSLRNLGLIAQAEEDLPGAREQFAESLRLNWELRNRWGVAFALEARAGLAAAEGEARCAALLFGAAAALRATIGAPLPPSERPPVARNRAAARAALGEDVFEAAWTAGRQLPLPGAVALALDEGPDLNEVRCREPPRSGARQRNNLEQSDEANDAKVSARQHL